MEEALYRLRGKAPCVLWLNSQLLAVRPRGVACLPGKILSSVRVPSKATRSKRTSPVYVRLMQPGLDRYKPDAVSLFLSGERISWSPPWNPVEP